MARKLFFAAFVIDEESYTPEPGPVDRHFVCSDLVQSNFGEQPGVSDIIVWDDIEELVADQRQPGTMAIDDLDGTASAASNSLAAAPEICSQRHRNLGDGACADPASSAIATPRSFRDHLSAVMRNAPVFEYYEVRPCIESDGQTTSFVDEGDYAADLTVLQNRGEAFRTFWSLFGVDAGTHRAIGDFVSKEAAHEVMNAILAIPAAARNAVNAGQPLRSADGSDIGSVAGRAADWLDDMINQSSNNERI